MKKEKLIEYLALAAVVAIVLFILWINYEVYYVC